MALGMRLQLLCFSCNIFFLLCAQDNLGVKKSRGPLEKPLEIADYVFCPHKK
jgi:hypothetical protein